MSSLMCNIFSADAKCSDVAPNIGDNPMYRCEQISRSDEQNDESVAFTQCYDPTVNSKTTHGAVLAHDVTCNSSILVMTSNQGGDITCEIEMLARFCFVLIFFAFYGYLLITAVKNEEELCHSQSSNPEMMIYQSNLRSRKRTLNDC
ncbi:hypothetical protein DdX_00895 [Ditylenchus destructor]|uniref:Uncharacterized protein n=1 Tax=Ditylenchus destructor TaxID=166010 RepID=A0AAD4NEJ4_9BILA|nr:hypothetical protein DdX_00895 [Ditylenchus destructor]